MVKHRPAQVDSVTHADVAAHQGCPLVIMHLIKCASAERGGTQAAGWLDKSGSLAGD